MILVVPFLIIHLKDYTYMLEYVTIKMISFPLKQGCLGGFMKSSAIHLPPCMEVFLWSCAPT